MAACQVVVEAIQKRRRFVRHSDPRGRISHSQRWQTDIHEARECLFLSLDILGLCMGRRADFESDCRFSRVFPPKSSSLWVRPKFFCVGCGVVEVVAKTMELRCVSFFSCVSNTPHFLPALQYFAVFLKVVLITFPIHSLSYQRSTSSSRNAKSSSRRSLLVTPRFAPPRSLALVSTLSCQCSDHQLDGTRDAITLLSWISSIA